MTLTPVRLVIVWTAIYLPRPDISRDKTRIQSRRHLHENSMSEQDKNLEGFELSLHLEFDLVTHQSEFLFGFVTSEIVSGPLELKTSCLDFALADQVPRRVGHKCR